jgi:hypothetical protein
MPRREGHSPLEQEHLGEDSIGFISFLESAGVLPPPMREMVIDRPGLRRLLRRFAGAFALAVRRPFTRMVFPPRLYE